MPHVAPVDLEASNEAKVDIERLATATAASPRNNENSVVSLTKANNYKGPGALNPGQT